MTRTRWAPLAAGEARLTVLGADAAHEAILATVDQEGALILEGLLDPAELERLRAELRSHLDACAPGSRSPSELVQLFHGRNTKRFCGLVARAPSFLDVLLHPTLRALADHLLLPHCGSYWLNTAQVIAVGPGEPEQLLHRDEANWPHFPWPGPELTVSAMLALGDFTEANGATRVVPASHLWDEPLRQADPSEVAAASMRAGSALLYTGKVLHGAGANRSGGWRLGLHVSFVLGWLRPEENHYLALPGPLARALPERAQQLLGYRSYYPSGIGGRLGLVDFEEAGLALAPLRPSREP
jgi:ectoine hydroxylase-related dioxygenase (phytanoyl-CoA dioxygenase family)